MADNICKCGWIYFRGHCYYFSTKTAMTWPQADVSIHYPNLDRQEKHITVHIACWFFLLWRFYYF